MGNGGEVITVECHDNGFLFELISQGISGVKPPEKGFGERPCPRRNKSPVPAATVKGREADVFFFDRLGYDEVSKERRGR